MKRDDIRVLGLLVELVLIEGLLGEDPRALLLVRPCDRVHGRVTSAPKVGLNEVCLSHPVCFPFLYRTLSLFPHSSFSFFLYNTLSFPLYFPGKTPWKSSIFGL